jgi:pimeloyl-ACP methyl ester carboxylesterase
MASETLQPDSHSSRSGVTSRCSPRRSLPTRRCSSSAPRSPRSASPGFFAAPTLVIHGTADPMFPIEHGKALAAAIPGARLLTLEAAGHGVYRADWEAIVEAILEHT